MNRRNFVRNGVLAGASLSTATQLLGQENKKEQMADKPFNLNYACLKIMAVMILSTR